MFCLERQVCQLQYNNRNYYIYEDNEQKRLERDLYKKASGMSTGNLFVIGVAQQQAQKLSTPLLSKVSRAVGEQIQSDASYMNFLKVNTMADVQSKLEENYQKFQISTSGVSGVSPYSFQNVVSTGISNRLNNKLGDILQQSVHVGQHMNIAGYTLQYEQTKRMIQPQSQQSLSNYLISKLPLKG